MSSPSPEFARTRAAEREEHGVRHLHGVLICPRCGQSLTPCEHDLGIAWRCLHCRGQSLNFSQFRRMVPEDGANNLWATARERPQAPGLRTRCPECRADMDAVYIPLPGRAAELDICRPCQRLWLDRQDEPETGPAGALAIIAPQRERSRLSFLRRYSRPLVAARGRCEADLSRLEREHDGKEKKRWPVQVLKLLFLLGMLWLFKYLVYSAFGIRGWR